ncbi:uncharacterized protein DS421_13g410480 [Arachis hypogaea]|nr:uncharacterized protein DS421_13g410480 [Arachis hypogaea]
MSLSVTELLLLFVAPASFAAVAAARIAGSLSVIPCVARAPSAAALVASAAIRETHLNLVETRGLLLNGEA